MEIIISINEEGRVIIQKSEELAILSAVGLLELAKKIMLENGKDFKSMEEGTNVEVESEDM